MGVFAAVGFIVQETEGPRCSAASRCGPELSRAVRCAFDTQQTDKRHAYQHERKRFGGDAASIEHLRQVKARVAGKE